MADALAVFRTFPDHRTQELMALEHLTYIVTQQESSTLEVYNLRINWNRDEESGEEERTFAGAYSSDDGTYTLACRFHAGMQRSMYTGYKKYHAYKLMIKNSIFKKGILSISVHPARTSDPMCKAFNTAVNIAEKRGMFSLGDDAFQGEKWSVTPFTTAQISSVHALDPSAARKMASWNFSHSSNRMSSEHAIGSLKQWACIRGTGKYHMFRSHEAFKCAVMVIHSLVNGVLCNFDDKDVASIFTSVKRS